MSDSLAHPDAPNLPEGRRLGHYEIVGLIGEGGMGQVYRARDTRLQREVALKLLPGDTAAAPERRQRFEREARAVAALNHPNIVTIHSVDDVDGRVFLTMELVKGRPLSELIGAAGMPLERLLKVAVPLADAVAAAHARGITHRDLKPANVMVTDEGHVKVLDFGLAKVTDLGPAADGLQTAATDIVTGQGRIVGTIAYMSPEQAEAKAVDPRSDVFSLGVMLYEMATGVRPFQGDTSLSTLTAILRDAPRPVTDVNPGMPKELGRVIRRALSKEPDRRQQTGRDLRHDLDEVRMELESGELSARPIPPGTAAAASPAGPSGSGERSAVTAADPAGLAGVPPGRPWMAFAAGLVLVGAVAAAFVWARRDVPGPAPAVAEGPIGVSVASITNEDGVEQFPSLSADGKWVVYTGQEPGAGQSDILLRAVGGQSAINLTRESAGNDSQPVFSRDGERIAFRSERDGGGLFVMGRTGEAVRRLTNEGFNPSWSPDGQSIVYATEEVTGNPGARGPQSLLWVVSTTTGERRQLTSVDAVQPAWSPHGQRVAYWAIPVNTSQRDLWTVAAGGGEPVRVTDDDAIDWSPAWSPDGRYLYFSSDRSGGFGLWRVAIDEASGRPLGEPTAVPVPRARIGHLSFSADGLSVAMTSDTSGSNVEALTWDPQNSTVTSRRRVTNSSEFVVAPSVSPDGQWLAFGESDHEDVWVVKADGTGPRQVTNDVARDRRPVWSPDGRRLMFYSDRDGKGYQVYTIAADGGSLMQVSDYPSALVTPVWSPDGTRAVVKAIRAATVFLFDPRRSWAEQQVAELAPFDGFHPSAWSPDGTRLAGQMARTSGGIVVYTFATQRYEEIASSGVTPAWMPDGRRLLYAAGDQLRLVDLSTKVSMVVFSPSGDRVSTPVISPDGRTIYAVLGRLQADIVMAKLSASAP